MTRKDYQSAALGISTMNLPSKVKEKVIGMMIDLFKADNPRFDETRFRETCK